MEIYECEMRALLGQHPLVESVLVSLSIAIKAAPSHTYRIYAGRFTTSCSVAGVTRESSQKLQWSEPFTNAVSDVSYPEEMQTAL